MSVSIQQNWTTASAIKRQEFKQGYWDESEARSRNPTECIGGGEAAVDALQHTHGGTAASETTLYADKPQGGYNPDEQLLDGRTRRQKYADIWQYNAGHDSHRADGKSREECHKVDENAAYKRRLAEAVCDSLRISSVATERATDLAADNVPPRLNFLGGLMLWILAAAHVAAEEHDELGRLDDDAFDRFYEKHDITKSALEKATDLVGGDE